MSWKMTFSMQIVGDGLWSKWPSFYYSSITSFKIFVLLFIPSLFESLKFPLWVPSDLMYHSPPLHSICNSFYAQLLSNAMAIFVLLYGDFLVIAPKTILGRSIICFYLIVGV